MVILAYGSLFLTLRALTAQQLHFPSGVSESGVISAVLRHVHILLAVAARVKF